ncbi:unnamed protein product [Camellia sinensis]
MYAYRCSDDRINMPFQSSNFVSFINTIASVTSKAGEALGKIGRDGGGSSTSGRDGDHSFSISLSLSEPYTLSGVTWPNLCRHLEDRLETLAGEDLDSGLAFQTDHNKKKNKQEYSLGVARNKISRNQESRKIRKEESKNRKAQVNEELKKMGDTHMIVATLIATITFAAGCTMPGGYNSNEGSNQGMPLLLREAAFKVFVITNTIAMICSTSSALLYVTASVYYVRNKDEVSKKMKRYIIALNLILIAVAAMIVAFIAGSLAVLTHSLGLVISVYLIGGA